ncbi:MAG: DEAD/DEAH box helicase family protein, partial [Ureaplasma sp.]|nr:DEAD/DEAH box helicase family protein [Ureaplasma sp.]
MILTNSQTNAVNKLFNQFKNKNNGDKSVYFKAPTGSGKTFMSSELISRIFEYNNSVGIKSIVIVATVSSASLPAQFAKKLETYKKYHQFNNYSIEHIHSPSDSKNNKLEQIREFELENNKVFVFGISSFGKNKLFTLHNTLDNFIREAKRQNYEIIFIRDEAHIGPDGNANKNDLKNFDFKMENSSDFIVKMTATPKEKIKLIELTIDDLQNDDKFLLKSRSQDIKFDDEKSEEEVIESAIKKFIETKQEYSKLENVVINPAMLIQINNSSNVDKEKKMRYDAGMELLEKKLNKYGLKYLKYTENEHVVIGTNSPNTLEYASKNDSIIDVIIFKVGPATGWDIPRANILLQLRSISSNSLNMQTVGRIMRNPYPNLEKHEVTDKYYLYSNYQKPSRTDANYRLENKFDNLVLYMGKINEKYNKMIEDNNKYIKSVKEYINSDEFKNIVIDFLNENIIYDKENISGKEIAYPII